MREVTHKLLSLFTTSEKWRLLALLVAILAMGLVDVIGISSILPFIAVVAQPEVIRTSSVLSTMYAWTGFSNPDRFLFFLGVLALIAVIVSNGVSLFVSWAIVAYSQAIGHSLSVRVLERYLRQPYIFFLDRNSTALMLNATGEVAGVVNGVLIPGMQALSKLALVFCLTLLAIVVEPAIAAIFLVLAGGAYLLLFKVVKSSVTKLGERSQESNRTKFRTATELFGGIKDLMVLGRTDNYLDRFRHASSEFARWQSRQGAVGLVPRYALETIAFGGILVLALYLLATGQKVSEALPLMVLFAFLGYRLMPAFQMIFYGMTQIRFNLPSLELLTREFAQPQDFDGPLGSERAGTEDVFQFFRDIELREVTFSYPRASSPIVEKFTLRIEKNTTVGLVGETGSGKTTLADIVLGLLQPAHGQLLVDGTPINPGNLRTWQRNLGYVPQQIFLSDDTVARNIAFGLPESAIDRVRLEEVARIANIHEFVVSQLPQRYDTPIGERGVRLSGGQRQRIGIARALYHDPSVLIMDEATSALDGITEDAIIDAIHTLSHKKTIILIAHRFATVQDCDRIYLLDKGRLIDQGSYSELIVRSERFRAMAKVDVRL